MKLTELNPNWLCYGGHGLVVSKTKEPIPLVEGVGINFDCPCGCGKRLGIAFDKTLEGKDSPLKGDRILWHREGTTFEDLTLTPSIQNMDVKTNKEHWHGFLTNGEFIKC